MLLTNVLLWFLPQAAALPPKAAPAREPSHHLVQVRIKDARSLALLQTLDLDLAACTALELPVRVVDVIAKDSDIAKLRRSGLEFEVAVRNLEDSIERRLSQFSFPNTLTPPVGRGAMGGHYTLAQIVAHLDKFHKDHPAICAKKVSLGKSVQGRDLWMVKISDNVNRDESEPEVLFDALHHAREPLSATTTLQFMDWLLDNYGKDAEATFIVNNRELYFVPCVNPDGYEYNRSIRPGGGGLWRKNRRNNGGSTGVDLNRNWATGWGGRGSSGNGRSETYRGPKPQSEPEIQALDNFIKSRKFVLGHSAHTYTEVLLRPWGFQRSEPANAAEYRKIDAAALAKNPMRSGAASILLYLADGTALDHYHAKYGMYGYTAELGRRSEGGFWPSPANQVRIANRHQHMFKTFALVAGANLTIDAASIAEAGGGNNNGKVEPGEDGLVRATVSNAGASATLTTAALSIKSLTTGVSVITARANLGTVAKFSTVNNNAAPLRIRLASNFVGLVARLELSVAYEGITVKKRLDLRLGTPQPIVGTAFETDLGFRRANDDTASTGRFERAAPQRTTYQGRDYQPASDHTPGNGTRCWVTGAAAGSSVGANDVDGGRTRVLSPIMDLAHVAAPTLSIWLYYSESVPSSDAFTVEMSSNGGSSWSQVFRRNTSTPGWQQVRIELTGTMTSRMQFRFSAQDLQPSLVEACVDDLEIAGLVDKAALTILGGGQRGSRARFGLRGAPGAVGLPMLSATTGNVSIPGVDGKFLLGVSTLAFAPAVSYGGGSSATFDVPMPTDAGLVGVRIYFQQLLIQSVTSLKLGNRSSITIR